MDRTQYDRLTVRDLVMHGRRVVGAAPSVNSTDYVIKKELDTLQKTVEAKIPVFSVQVLKAYTTIPQSVYSGINNAQAGFVYAKVADLDALMNAYENLRLAFDDLRAKLIASGLIGAQ